MAQHAAVAVIDLKQALEKQVLTGHEKIVGLLEVGREAPIFRLADTSFMDVTLESLKGKSVILFTTHSIDDKATQAETIAILKELLAKTAKLENTVILMVSKDFPAALNKRVASKEGISEGIKAGKIKLLSSLRKGPNFGQDYGVRITEGPFVGAFAGSLIAIDPQGRISYSERIVSVPNFDACLEKVVESASVIGSDRKYESEQRLDPLKLTGPVVTREGRPPMHIARQIPQKGSVAPDFVLTNTRFVEMSLKSFEGMYKIISTFPSVDTPTCELGMTKFNEQMTLLPNTVLLSVSQDFPLANNEFCGSKSINLDKVCALSAFRNSQFGMEYGVEIQEGYLEGAFARSVVVLDPNNKVIYSELVPELTKLPDIDAIISVIRASLDASSRAGMDPVVHALPSHMKTHDDLGALATSLNLGNDDAAKAAGKPDAIRQKVVSV